MGDIPRIISVDDHVVEPAHLWQDRLPARFKDEGPRVVIAPRGDMALVNGSWVEAPGDSDQTAAWWRVATPSAIRPSLRLSRNRLIAMILFAVSTPGGSRARSADARREALVPWESADESKFVIVPQAVG